MSINPESEGVDAVQTLTGVLDYHAREHPHRLHARFYEGGEESEQLTYGELFERASSVGYGLQERSIEPGDSVAIMLPTGPAYFYAFYGVLLAGGVPVPIYPPARLSGIVDHLRRMQQCFRWDAADVQANTAQHRPALDENDVHAQSAARKAAV